jgi:hypothetical protein
MKGIGYVEICFYGSASYIFKNILKGKITLAGIQKANTLMKQSHGFSISSK